MAKKKKKRYGRKKKGYGGITAAVLYGAARQYVSGYIAQYTNKFIPVAGVADEIGMYLVNHFVAKRNFGIISQAARYGKVIELARMGEFLVSGALFPQKAATTTTSNGKIF